MLRVLEPVPRVLEPVPCVCHIHVQLETAAFVPKRVPWAPIVFPCGLVAAGPSSPLCGTSLPSLALPATLLVRLGAFAFGQQPPVPKQQTLQQLLHHRSRCLIKLLKPM